jgi:anti-sigma regulatory factor (Ser/Thr protein kinase)
MNNMYHYPPDTSYPDCVTDLIDKLSSECNLYDEFCRKMNVAVIEAVTMPVCHGNKLDQFKKVTVSKSFEGNKLVFQLLDEGSGFNSLNLPDHTPDSRNTVPGGRGILFIISMVDKICFYSNGSEIEETFNP